MAKRRRRKRRAKELGPIDPASKKVKKERVHTDAVRPPNHMVPKVLYKIGTPKASSYPMLRLTVPSSKGAGTAGHLAFVDERHECVVWTDRQIYAPPYAPPTWMDPEVFVRMVLKSEAAQKLQETATSGKKLMVELQKVFEEQYLPYMIGKFNDDVKGLLAEWLIARAATKALDAPKKKKAVKKAVTVGEDAAVE